MAFTVLLPDSFLDTLIDMSGHNGGTREQQIALANAANAYKTAKIGFDSLTAARQPIGQQKLSEAMTGIEMALKPLQVASPGIYGPCVNQLKDFILLRGRSGGI